MRKYVYQGKFRFFFAISASAKLNEYNLLRIVVSYFRLKYFLYLVTFLKSKWPLSKSKLWRKNVENLGDGVDRFSGSKYLWLLNTEFGIWLFTSSLLRYIRSAEKSAFWQIFRGLKLPTLLILLIRQNDGKNPYMWAWNLKKLPCQGYDVIRWFVAQYENKNPLTVISYADKSREYNSMAKISLDAGHWKNLSADHE